MDTQIPQNPIETQVSKPSNSTLFSLKNKYLAILIVILCLTSLGSAIYFLVLHNKRESTNNNIFPTNIIVSPSPSPLPSLELPPSSVDVTSNWPTYNGEGNAFSIKYPKDWTAKNTLQEDPKILQYVVFNPKEATKAGELSITLTYTTRAYKQILDADPQPGEKITVASVTATRKVKQDSERNVLISVVLPHNSNTIIFLGKEKYKDIFNQMLTTLELKTQ